MNAGLQQVQVPPAAPPQQQTEHLPSGNRDPTGRLRRDSTARQISFCWGVAGGGRGAAGAVTHSGAICQAASEEAADR